MTKNIRTSWIRIATQFMGGLFLAVLILGGWTTSTFAIESWTATAKMVLNGNDPAKIKAKFQYLKADTKENFAGETSTLFKNPLTLSVSDAFDVSFRFYNENNEEIGRVALSKNHPTETVTLVATAGKSIAATAASPTTGTAAESNGKPAPDMPAGDEGGGAAKPGSSPSAETKPAFPAWTPVEVTQTCEEAAQLLGRSRGASYAPPFGANSLCLTDYLGKLYNWALVVGSGLAIVMIMWAGYTYVVAAGDPEAIRSAKDYLWGALLGLGLLIMTTAIARTLQLKVADQVPISTAAPAAPAADPATPATAPAAPAAGGGGAPAAAPSIAGTYTLKVTQSTVTGSCGTMPAQGESLTATLSQSTDASATLALSSFGKTVPGTLSGTNFSGQFQETSSTTNSTSKITLAVSATFNAQNKGVNATITYTNNGANMSGIYSCSATVTAAAP